MNQNIYSIYDEKAEMFNVPFFQRTEGMAIRNLADMAKDPQSIISKHPHDFTLYCLGVWNDNTGMLQTFDAPKPIGSAISFLSVTKDENQTELDLAG